MLNLTQELSNKIAAGNHWLLHDGVNIIEAYASRDAARAEKGENKIKKWDGAEGFNLIGSGEPQQDDSIQGVVEAAEAVGLNVIVIDENTDFSKLTINQGAAMEHATVDERTEADKAFDNPHHGHMEEEDESNEPRTQDQQDSSEFAEAKEAGVEVKDLETKPIDPQAEDKPKAKPPVSHKSTVEKPTKLVHVIADMLADANPDVTRKEIIAACTEAGIAYYTILTQYQAWKANR